MKTAILIAAALALPLALGACGRKGPPNPPSNAPAPATQAQETESSTE
ncbi:MAG: hypothetical protein AAF415_09130 [Pseudomonadota bacterium]